ncbi:MAG TPA: TonB-dependent receptor, partial [Pseudomonadaceae bacterium]|nr:TonB-dependent receptor [Pseudomonadaceae bacterium]
IGSLEARQIDQVGPDHSRYDNWQDWGLVRNPNWVSATATPNEPSRIHAPYVFTSGGAPQGMLITGGDFAYQNWVFTDDGAGVRPYAFGDYMSNAGSGNTNNQSGGPEYLYYDRASPRGMSTREVAQRSFFGGFKYDVSDNFHIFGQTVLGRSESNFYDNVSNMAFSAFPLYAFKVFRENAYLPEVVGTEMDRLGLDMINMIPVGVIEGPGLTNIYDERGDRSVQQLQSYTAGFEWDIDNNWNLTGSFQSGETKISTGILNVPRLDKYFMAADAVRHPETNEIVCNISLVNPSPEQLAAVVDGVKFPSPIDPLGIDVDSPLGPLNPQECVPFNIFGIGNANQEARDWILEKEKKQMRWLNQDFAELLLTGVVHEGWGAGPLSIATGLTWRDEDFRQINRPSYGERGLLNVPALGIRAISDGFAGAGNRSLHPFSSIGVGDGARDVWEWYAELNVPLWEWDGGQRIGSTMAYRSSDYSGSGRQESWKLGLDMQVMESLRWRVTKSQDIREPNFAEIFLTGTGGGQVQDPFRGDETAGGITVLATSNPALGAEMGDTITTGLVWQPVFAEWIEGLQVAVDWYEINLEGAVAPYGAQRIVDDCFATGAASACDLIQRVPNVDDDGFGYTPISRILNQNVNADFAQTRGVDFEVIYNTDVDFFSDEAEALSLRALFGYLAENSTTTLAGTTQDQAQSRTRPE